RRLGVVDIADAVQIAHELEPMRHACECAESVGDRGIGDARDTRGGGGGGGVLSVVYAGDARLRGQRIVSRELDSLQPDAARDDLRKRTLEDPQLGVAVGLERALPVEMLGLAVEQYRHVARE